jgi:hypothetical protein
MAAMRGATHQKLQSFDFCNDPGMVAQYAAAQQQFLYPNPTQTNVNGARSDGYMMDGGFARTVEFWKPSVSLRLV